MAESHEPSSYGEEMQIRTRRERGFSDAEASLPTVSQHSSFKLADATSNKAAAKSKVTNLLSYLGPYNPRPLPITEKDAVWLMDNVAYRTAEGHWEAEFVAAAFQQQAQGKIVDTVQEVADKIGLSSDDKAIDTIQERLIPFTQDILPGRQILVTFGGDSIKLGPGGRNGISSDLRTVPGSRGGFLVSSQAEVAETVTGILEMKTLFAEPEGWGVISGELDPAGQPAAFTSLGALTFNSRSRHRRYNQDHADERSHGDIDVHFRGMYLELTSMPPHSPC